MNSVTISSSVSADSSASGIAAGRTASRKRATPFTLSHLGRLIGTWVIPFALVLYLGLEGGGYDEIVRGQVGVIAWWLILLGSLCGILPVAKLPATAWVACGCLAALATWTAISISWSDSAERSVIELVRVATLGGIFVLGLLSQGPDGLRRALTAAGSAIAIIGVLALLSRLHPAWFPESQNIQFQTVTARIRLNFPLNYWNGLAGLIAIGLPLLLMMSLSLRSIALRSVSAAAVPALALTAYFTLSRGGAIAVASGIIVLLACWPRRLVAAPTLAAIAVGSAVLIVAASQRNALENGLRSATAASQGNEMLAMTVVVCTGIALLTAAIALAIRVGLLRLPSPPSRRTTAAASIAVVLAALVVAIAAGLPGQAADAWDTFKEPGGPGTSTAERLASANGSNRYQFWQAALDANATDPLKGIGAGTYEYWWSSEGTLPTFVRDAHSLYLESLAETGIVGLALLTVLLGLIVFRGVVLLMRSELQGRTEAAAALAAILAFLIGAAFDWSWEMTVLPATFFLVAAGLFVGEGPKRPSAFRTRLGFSIAAIVALVVIALPLGSETALRKSQEAAQDGNFRGAIEYAQDAARLQPYAASPRLQEALVLEAAGDLDPAATAAAQATDREPTNWRTWQVRSRIAVEQGHARTAAYSYRKAKALNPRSPLFAPPDGASNG